MRIASTVVMAAVAALAGTASADMVTFDPAQGAPQMERVAPHRPPRMTCFGPAGWAEIVKCQHMIEPSARIAAQPSPHTQLMMTQGQTRLYAQRPTDGKWQFVRMIDAQTHIVGEAPIALRHAYRVELRQQQQFNTIIVRVKDAMVCGLGDGSCRYMTYSCAFLDRGRTRSVFLGVVALNGDDVTVEADRSRAAPNCLR